MKIVILEDDMERQRQMLILVVTMIAFGGGLLTNQVVSAQPIQAREPKEEQVGLLFPIANPPAKKWICGLPSTSESRHVHAS